MDTETKPEMTVPGALDGMKELNPHTLLIIGHWAGGKVQMATVNTPLEVLCYMRACLDRLITHRFDGAGKSCP